jgi:hypothetical protein
MRHSKRETETLSVRSLTSVGSSLMVAALVPSLVVDSISAAPYPTVGQNNFGEDRVYSPYAGRVYPDRVFFGDTHIHTNLSPDAGLIYTPGN